MAILLVRKCENIDGGLPTALQSRMYFNVMLDFALGLVPILGDFADVLYRANTRNAWLLESYLVKRRDAKNSGRITDPETGTIFDTATLDTGLPTAPPPARQQNKSPGGFSRFFRNRDRPLDEERAGDNLHGGNARTGEIEEMQQNQASNAQQR
jgi:hypothetical protein